MIVQISTTPNEKTCINQCSTQECLQHYETALDYCKRELQNDEAYLSAITVTITYNLARLYEALHEFGKVYQFLNFLRLKHCSNCLAIFSMYPDIILMSLSKN